MKKIIPLLVIAGLFITNWVYADENTNSGTTSTNSVLSSDSKQNMIKWNIDLKREELRKLRELKFDTIKQNRTDIVKNRENFREENKDKIKDFFSGLEQDQKDKLKTLTDETKTTIKSLQDEYKWKLTDAEKRKEFEDKILELLQDNYSETKDIVWDNSGALELLEDRKVVFLENQKLREANRQARVEFRWDRADLITESKEILIKRLENIIPKLQIEKLNTISGKIDTMITQIESNNKLTAERKDTLVSQLIALKEIIEEEIEKKWLAEDINLLAE